MCVENDDFRKKGKKNDGKGSGDSEVDFDA
jgi:hypothetical protein